MVNPEKQKRKEISEVDNLLLLNQFEGRLRFMKWEHGHVSRETIVL